MRLHARVAAATVVILSSAGVMVSAPPAGASSSDYRLAYATTPDGARRVVRWNPCQKITYRVNLAHAGSSSAARTAALRDVKGAISRLTASTGIPFVYEGGTSQIPTSTSTTSWWRRQSSAELVIAWVDQSRAATRSSLLGRESSGRWAAGTGGYVYKYWTASGKWRLAAGRGFLVLDAAQRARFTPGFGSGVTRGALLLHELAHAMGLAHVGVTSQIMYPVLRSRSSTYYRAGDRAGLARLGRPAGCISVPRDVWPAI